MSSLLEKIMIIDDERDLQEIAAFSLATAGNYHVKVCSSGEEALEVLKEFTPQMVLLDVMMPKMDGPTLYQKMKDLPGVQSAVVVFVTAKVEPSALKSYRDLGVKHVIPKPFDPMTLPEQVLAIWEKEL